MQDPQIPLQGWQVFDVISKYEDLGQYSRQRPYDRTGRVDGHVRHDDADPGEEQVEQSTEQARQVPFVSMVPMGQAVMQDPLVATSAGAEHLVQVVVEAMQEAQLGSQTEHDVTYTVMSPKKRRTLASPIAHRTSRGQVIPGGAGPHTGPVLKKVPLLTARAFQSIIRSHRGERGDTARQTPAWTSWATVSG